MAKKKVELFEENLDKVAGGTGEENMNNGADNGEDNGGEGDGGEDYGTSGPNYNNDNRGGKQMNVQMGKNINSSKSNSMS